MKLSTYFFTLIIVPLLILNACAPKVNFDIRGDWEYTMTTTNGKALNLKV
jgi:hypothetical protein